MEETGEFIAWFRDVLDDESAAAELNAAVESMEGRKKNGVAS